MIYIAGTSMDLFLTLLKNKLVLRYTKYCRLKCEIFCIFQGNEELKKILNLLNAFKNNLQFTYEQNKETVHFLDMQVTCKSGELITFLYSKDGDRNTLFLATSANPKSLQTCLSESFLMLLFDPRCFLFNMHFFPQ